MEAFRKQLQSVRDQRTTPYVSIETLVPNRRYKILAAERTTHTQFGDTVRLLLGDTPTNKTIYVSKLYVSLFTDEVIEQIENSVLNLFFIYQGKSGRKFIYDIVE